MTYKEVIEETSDSLWPSVVAVGDRVYGKSRQLITQLGEPEQIYVNFLN